MLKYFFVAILVLPLIGCGTAVEIEVIDRSTGNHVTTGSVYVGTQYRFFPSEDEAKIDDRGIARLRINLQSLTPIVKNAGFMKEPDPTYGDRWHAFLEGLGPDANPKGTNHWVEYVVPWKY